MQKVQHDLCAIGSDRLAALNQAELRNALFGPVVVDSNARLFKVGDEPALLVAHDEIEEGSPGVFSGGRSLCDGEGHEGQYGREDCKERMLAGFHKSLYDRS